MCRARSRPAVRPVAVAVVPLSTNRTPRTSFTLGKALLECIIGVAIRGRRLAVEQAGFREQERAGTHGGCELCLREHPADPFAGEGDADIYDVNLNPKPQYTALQQTLSLAPGAPNRGGPHDHDHDRDQDD